MGMRIFKTGLAVFICLSIARLFHYENPFYACLSCVLMMKETPTESLKSGFDRTIGTLLGALIAQITLVFCFVLELSLSGMLAQIIIPIAVIMTLMIAKFLHFREYAASMSCILVLAILINFNATLSTSLYYVVTRVGETLIGIGIATVINYVIIPINKKDVIT